MQNITTFRPLLYTMNERPTGHHILKKLYVPEFKHAIMKVEDGGVEKVFDLNFNHLFPELYRIPFPNDSQSSIVFPYPRPDRASIPDVFKHGSFINEYDEFCVYFYVAQDGVPSLQSYLTKDSDYPYFIYVADDETETIETAPFLEHPIVRLPTKADILHYMRPRIAAVAHRFAEGISNLVAWEKLMVSDTDTNAQQVVKKPVEGTTPPTVEGPSPAEVDAALRESNVSLWGRLHIGKVVQNLKDLKANPTLDESKAAVDSVRVVERQIPHKATVHEFFNRQNPNEWTEHLADEGTDPLTSLGRRIHLRDKDFNRGTKVYDINVRNTKNNVLDASAASAEYQQLLANYWEAFQYEHADHIQGEKDFGLESV